MPDEREKLASCLFDALEASAIDFTGLSAMNGFSECPIDGEFNLLAAADAILATGPWGIPELGSVKWKAMVNLVHWHLTRSGGVETFWPTFRQELDAALRAALAPNASMEGDG